MAGTAIAVALVPPVCVMGLMLSGPDISSAQGPALLYAANLLGILIGGITVLAIREPYFRDKLRRRRRSRLPVLLALGLAVLVGQKLYGRYEQYRYRLNREVAQKQIESEIRYYLKNETLTFGANDAVELEKVVFDWPDYWEQNQAPSWWWCDHSTPSCRVTNRFRTFKTRSTADLQDNSLALNCRCRCNAST